MDCVVDDYTGPHQIMTYTYSGQTQLPCSPNDAYLWLQNWSANAPKWIQRPETPGWETLPATQLSGNAGFSVGASFQFSYLNKRTQPARRYREAYLITTTHVQTYTIQECNVEPGDCSVRFRMTTSVASKDYTGLDKAAAVNNPNNYLEFTFHFYSDMSDRDTCIMKLQTLCFIEKKIIKLSCFVRCILCCCMCTNLSKLREAQEKQFGNASKYIVDSINKELHICGNEKVSGKIALEIAD